MNKSKIFIGSSVEGLNIAYAIQQNLTYDAEITVWSQGIFELSMTTIESLMLIIEQSDFAIFIFTADDILKIRKEEHLSVRDNVIFELGLFIGKIGRERTFIIVPDKTNFHIPTDLLGITAGKYETDRSDGSFLAATGPVCHQIRTQINKIGPLNFYENNSEGNSNSEIDKDKYKELLWWDYYFDKDYEKAIETIDKQIEKVINEKEREDLKYWKYFVKYKINSTDTKKEMSQNIDSDNENINLYRAYSKVLIYQDETELAKKFIEDGLLKFPENEDLLKCKSIYLDKIGKHNDAVTLLKSLNYEENEDIINLIIEFQEKAETDTLEQFKFYLKIYMENPSYENVGFKLAKLAYSMDKHKMALHILSKLVNQNPKDITYHGYLGNSCVSLELNNKAFTFYQKANKFAESKQSWILSNIGNVLKNMGLFEEAKKYLNESIKLQSESEYALNRLSETIKLEDEENKLYQKLLKEGMLELNAELENSKNNIA